MKPMDITIVVELLLRRPGTVIDRQAIADALRRIGLDTRADIVNVRVVLGTVDEVVVAAAARDRVSLPSKTTRSPIGDDDYAEAGRLTA